MAMNDYTNIIVGCGGSGMKTLCRLVDLLSEDIYWRPSAHTHLAFLIVDTDTEDIKKFERHAEERFRTVGAPIIRSVVLSKGLKILEKAAYPLMVHPFQTEDDRGLSEEKKTGMRRLHAHWWFHDEECTVPFTAPRANPLHEGAGQCPPASYFLAWLNMEEIGDKVRDIIDTLRTRQGADPLKEVNVSIVSGLSGGTGRGCWELVAFKLRQIISQRFRTPVAPFAFLYDSSIYSDVADKHHLQGMPLKVNSLTGISQLSLWIANKERAEEGSHYRYTLPNMSMPEEEKQDVLNIDLEVANRAAGASPVDSAFIVFNESKSAVLKKCNQAYDMVGTAMYAAMTRSSIRRTGINDCVRKYLGVASSVFELNNNDLYNYFSCKRRVETLRTLKKQNENAAKEAVDEVFESLKLFLETNEKNWKAKYVANENGNFLQRVCHYLVKKYSNDFNHLSKFLKKDNVKKSKEQIEIIASENADRVRDAIKDTIEAFDAPFGKIVTETLKKLYKSHQSLEVLNEFLKKLKARLGDTLERLPEASHVKFGPSADPTELVEEYADREYWIFGRRYDRNEIEDLMNRTRVAVLYENYSLLKASISKEIKSWIAPFTGWEDNIARAMGVLRELEVSFENEIGEDESSFLKNNFTDYDHPENKTPTLDMPERFVRRTLHPILKKEDLVNGSLHNFGDIKLASAVTNLVYKAVFGTKTARNDEDDFKFKNDLRDAVEKNSILPSDYMEKNYTIKKNVTGIREAWQDRLNTEHDPDMRRQLIRKAQSYFGVTPMEDGGKFFYPEVDEFIIRMGISLAKTSVPYILLDKDTERNRQKQVDQVVSVFLPSDVKLDEQVRENVASEITKLNENSNIMLDLFEGGSSTSPFLLLAYSADAVDSLEKVISLDYWKDDPDVMKWLIKCENESGSSVTKYSTEHNGIGYVDPLYVREKEEIVKYRWHPWIDHGPDPEHVINKSLDAMIYALLDPPEELKQRLLELKKVGWELPLLMDLGKERYHFMRNAYVWEGEKVDYDLELPWAGKAASKPDKKKKGKKEQGKRSICTSIWQVFDVLSGKGIKNTGRLKREGIDWRDRILLESEVFWNKVAPKLGIAKGSGPYQDLLKHQGGIFREQLAGARGPDDRATWEKLINRIKQLNKLAGE